MSFEGLVEMMVREDLALLRVKRINAMGTSLCPRLNLIKGTCHRTSRHLTIDQRFIGDETDPYVIAEIGHNHQGKVETCKELFRAAKECGAHSVKLQN